MRSIFTQGVWTDETGHDRNARFEIAFEGTIAKVIVSLIGEEGVELTTGNRHTVYYLGRVERSIRNAEYANRKITPDPKPKDEKAFKRERV